MYINFTHLYSKGLSEKDLFILQKIFQKEFILLEPHLSEFERLLDLDLIQYLKGKANTVEGVRISKKGKTFLNQVETMGYTDDIGKLVNMLVELYEARQKPIGNELEVQSRLIWFLSQTGFSGKVIYEAIEEYLMNNDTYTMSLENLIWRPQSKAFSVHKNLKDSRIYDYICKKYRMNQAFFIKDNKGVDISWLSSVANLTPPKKASEELYFTSSYDGDMKHIQKIKKMYLNKSK